MLDKKRRLFRLIETYINDYQREAVEEMYGVGAKIKIHNIAESQRQNGLNWYNSNGSKNGNVLVLSNILNLEELL